MSASDTMGARASVTRSGRGSQWLRQTARSAPSTSLGGSSARRRAPATGSRSPRKRAIPLANEGMLEAEVRRQSFNRRSFLGKLAGTAGAAVLVAAAAGCQGVQQALGPKTNPPPGGTPSGGTPAGGSVPSAGSAGATGAAPSTGGGAAPAQGA